MLYLKNICAFLLLWQFAAANITGYCNEKQLTTVHRNITLSREVIRKKGVWPFRKTVKDIEYYNETVPHMIWRTVVRCCEGYQMNAQQKCGPNCSPNCPLHADCIATNTCKCHVGYREVFDSSTAGLECVLPTIKVETEATVTTTEIVTDYDSYTWETSTDNSFEPTDDCRISECPEFAKCMENGTCVCQEGHVWHEQRTDNEQSMQLDMYCLPENSYMSRRDIGSESFSSFMYKMLAILTGVALIVAFSALLIWHYKKKTSMQINVENGKLADKNVHCMYMSDKEDATTCVVY